MGTKGYHRTNTERSCGEWLRRSRRALDLTQEQLARQVGCSTITLRKLEAEERHPSRLIVERLADILGVAPDNRPALLRLARGDPFAAPTDSKTPGPPSPPLAPRHNLPLQLTSFVGREREIAEVTQLLSTARLVTLTGAGGSGKTRLALQVTAGLLDYFANGAWLVDLAPLADPALVPQTVGVVLGLKKVPGRSVTDVLLEHFRVRQLLLVLDNCERLIEGCARLVERLLRTCPHLTVLATSREALSIPGETTFLLPTLSSPSSRDAQSVDALTQYDAVRLFVERAQSAMPGFTLTNANAPAVVRVCQQLDGIPLALELAAARLRMLPVEQLAARLDDAFRLLTGGSRTALPRHQTLQALMDWSYDLLPEEERKLLRRLAVFAGGWTLEAAEAVCAGDGLGVEAVAGLLGHLIDKSLVLVAEQNQLARYRLMEELVEPEVEKLNSEQNQLARYRLMETVRQYAQARLAASGEADEVRRRQAEYYLALAEPGRQRIRARPPAWLDQMELEHDNLAAAVGWSQLAPDRVELALQLTAALSGLGFYRGYNYSEARVWLESVLARPEAANYPRARAAALLSLGQRFGFKGDFQAAETRFAQALNICRELGDRQTSAEALHWFGWATRERGDAATTCARLEESLVLYRELGDQSGILQTTNALAEAMSMEGDIVKAKTLLEKNLALARLLADPPSIGWALNHLGHIAQIAGEYEQAMRLHEASLPLFRQMRVRQGHIWAHQSLGETALAQGDARHAASHFAEALAVSRVREDREAIAWCLAGLAGVAALDEDLEGAAWLWGAAEALRQSIGVREAPASHATHERLKAQAREQLGTAAFVAQWAAGQAASWAAAMERALQFEAEGPQS